MSTKTTASADAQSQKDAIERFHILNDDAISLSVLISEDLGQSDDSDRDQGLATVAGVIVEKLEECGEIVKRLAASKA